MTFFEYGGEADQAERSVWLIDADNQPPHTARQAADLLGWPDVAILAGRPEALSSWHDGGCVFPPSVTVEHWKSPPIPEGADLLLAIRLAARWLA